MSRFNAFSGRGGFGGFGRTVPSATRAATQPTYDLTPEEEASLTGSLARGALGGLSMVGNALDLPGSSVRDLLGGENPFDQWLSPFSDENRVGGRGLLERAGMLRRNRPGFDAGDVAGFAVDVVLDPTTYTTFGASALGKGGQALKKAGIYADDIAKIAAKKAGKAGQKIGKRQARMQLKVSDVLEELTAGQRKAYESALTKGGKQVLDPTQTAKIADDTVGGLIGVGIPFKDPSFTFGRGSKSMAVANKLDALSEKAASTGMVRAARSALDWSVGAMKSRKAQKTMPAQLRALDEVEAAARGSSEKYAQLYRSMGLDSDNADRLVHDLYEAATDEDAARIVSEIAEETGNPSIIPDLHKLRERWSRDRDILYDKPKHYGIEPGFRDNYFHRSYPDWAKNLVKGGGRGMRENSTMHAARLGRADYVGDLPTNVVRDMGQNKLINETIEGGGSIDEIRNAIERYNVTDGGNKIDSTYLTKDEYVAKQNMLREGTQEIDEAVEDLNEALLEQIETGKISSESAHDQMGQLIEDMQLKLDKKVAEQFQGHDRYKKLAEWMSKMDPELRQAGIFEGDTRVAIQKMFTDSAVAEQKAKYAIETMADDDVFHWKQPTPVRVGIPGESKINQIVRVKPRAGAIAPETLGAHAPKEFYGKVVGKQPGGKYIQVEMADGTRRMVRPQNATPMAMQTAARMPDGAVPVKKIFDDLGMRLGDEESGALQALWHQKYGDDAIPTQADISGLSYAFVDKDVAEDLTSYVHGFKSPKSVNEIGKGIDSAVNFWKGWVTSTPAFHSRNTLSGQVKNFLKGKFGTKSVVAAKQLLAGEADPTGTLAKLPIVKETAKRWNFDQVAKLDPENLTNEEATDIFRSLLRQYDLTGKGQGEVAQTVGTKGSNLAVERAKWDAGYAGGIGASKSPVTLSKAVKALWPFEKDSWKLGRRADPRNVAGVGGRETTDFFVQQASQMTGELVEGMNRIAPFIKALGEGFDPMAAKRMVDDLQISYAAKHYTPLENQMLRLFPFGKFMRGESKWLGRELIERPGGSIAQTIRGTDALRGEPDRPIPEHISKGLAIPLPAGASGAPRFLAGAGLMHEAPLQMIGGSVPEVLAGIGGMLNPVVKIPAELATGTSLHRRGVTGGRPLESLDPMIGRTISNVMGWDEPADVLGTTGEAVASGLPIVNPTANIVRTMADPRKNAAMKALNLLTGFKVTDVSPAAQNAILDEAIQREMLALGGKPFTRVNIPKDVIATLPPEEQEAALKLNAINKLLVKEAKARKKAKESQSASTPRAGVLAGF